MTTPAALILATALLVATGIYALTTRYTPTAETTYPQVVDRWTGDKLNLHRP